MNRITTAMAVALSMIVFAVPGAVAEDLAGASGQCFDDDGSGGNAHLAVTDDGSVEEQGLTDVSEDDPTPGVADAVAALADGNGQPEQGNGCTSEDASQQDFLEVHVGGEQVCYDGDVRTDGECPTRT